MFISPAFCTVAALLFAGSGGPASVDECLGCSVLRALHLLRACIRISGCGIALPRSCHACGLHLRGSRSRLPQRGIIASLAMANQRLYSAGCLGTKRIEIPPQIRPQPLPKPEP